MGRAIALLLLVPLQVFAQCPWEKQLRQFVAQDPAALAKAAISRGDLRFLGVLGYVVIVPGVDAGKCTARRDRVRVIEGTSDVVCDAALQNTASEFAQTYNLIVKAELNARRVKYEECVL